MPRKLPWWLKDASNAHKRLYFAGCPKLFWNVTIDDLPKRQIITYHDQRRNVRISPKRQTRTMQRIHKNMHDAKRGPISVLIVSNPTDAAGLALLTWWCRSNPMMIVDLGSPPDPLDIGDRAIGIFNITAESEQPRITLARDYLYRYEDRFRAVCVSGVEDPFDYALNTLRFYKFNHVVHLDGPLRRKTGK